MMSERTEQVVLTVYIVNHSYWCIIYNIAISLLNLLNICDVLFQRSALPSNTAYASCGQTGRHVEAARLSRLRTQTGRQI